VITYSFKSLHYSYPYKLLTTMNKLPNVRFVPTRVAPFLVQMVAPGKPTGNSELLDLFGTPTLPWRVLNEHGYTEKPLYR